MTKDNLNNMIKEIILDKNKLKNMSEASKSLAILDVEERIIKEIKRLVRK